MRVLTQEAVTAIVERLQGTALSLNEAFFYALDIENVHDVHPDSLAEIELLVFQCTQCGWWCDVNEANQSCPADDIVCDECGAK